MEVVTKIAPIALALIMLGLGLGLTGRDFLRVINYPKDFLVGFICQLILLPVVAFIIVLILDLPIEIALGVMIIAAAPGGVTSNILTKIAKGNTALSISFTAFISIFSIFTLPVITDLSMKYFLGSESPPLNIFSLGLTMFFITTIPVSLGLYINSRYSSYLNTFKPLSNKISTVLFVVIVFGALSSEWNTFIENLSILAPSIFTLILIMLTIGYYAPKLFNVDNKIAKTIAIESSIQNATVGITIGNIIFNSSTGISVYGLTSGVYGILMYIVSLPIILLFLKNK